MNAASQRTSDQAPQLQWMVQLKRIEIARCILMLDRPAWTWYIALVNSQIDCGPRFTSGFHDLSG